MFQVTFNSKKLNLAKVKSINPTLSTKNKKHIHTRIISHKDILLVFGFKFKASNNMNSRCRVNPSIHLSGLTKFSATQTFFHVSLVTKCYNIRFFYNKLKVKFN